MNLKDVLFKDPHLKKFREIHQVSYTLNENWSDIWGKLAEEIEFDFIKNKQLFVKVSNPLWVKEIDFFKPMILEKINKLLPRQDHILGIRISLLPKKPLLNPQLDDLKETKEERENISLKDNISSLNREKIKKGYRLCASCNTVLTQDEICAFCRCEKSKKTF